MTKNIKAFFLLPLTAVFLNSCTDIEEQIGENKEQNDANKWIEQTMRQYYLWEDEIPDAKKLDFAAQPETFFESLLSNSDGKNNGTAHYFYSTINSKKKTKSYMGDDPSFGFEFQYFNITNAGAVIYYALQVLYVLPESPAAEKGLKRGDWILKINNKDIPNNTSELLKLLDTSSGAETVFGINSTLPKPLAIAKEISLKPRVIVDNPVFVDTTYTYGAGKTRIAYLVFNHFTSGFTDSDETFHNSLRNAFVKFKASQPQDFILDLRYNKGGLVKTAQLLSTMLAPANALNDVFCKFTYNSKLKSQNISWNLDASYMRSGTPAGENLDLKRLFIITSGRTASASETIINCLEPYMKGQIILVGSRTEGKNVASSTFADPKEEWEIHPIISRLSNKDGFSDYAAGFQPTYQCIETYQDDFYELGDLNEFMLKQVVNFIESGTPIADGSTRSLRSDRDFQLIPLYSSIERRAQSGLTLNLTHLP